MKITTDKVYYNGKEFIVNNWPEVKTYVNCFSEEACNCAKISFEKGWVRDVVDGYDDNCPHRYKSALTRAIEEGYVVSCDHSLLEILFPSPLVDNRFIPLREPWCFEVGEYKTDWNTDLNKYNSQRIAALLPKEEIKPAPLGESSEEQKDGFMIIDVFNDDGSHSHYALISTKTGEKLWSENPKECKAQGYPVSSPASEAPEEQTEILNAIDNLIAVLHGDGGHYREKHGRMKAIEDAQELLHKKWILDEGEKVQSEQNAMILGTLLDLNDQCYHYMKANQPEKTKMTYNSWESIIEQLQYHKSEYGTGKAPEEQEELWDEVLNYCANHYINDVRVREYMQKNFIIHRKRD